MLGLLRLSVMLLAMLTVIYWSVFCWFRAGERDRLESEWRRDKPPLPMHTHVEIGLRNYERPLHRRLLWVIYVAPCVAVAVSIYVLNGA